MIDSDYDELFDRIRGNLGEHFGNYMFIVMDEDGDLFYDYTNYRVGRMLVKETQIDMDQDMDSIEILWESEEEEESEDGDTI